MTRRTLGPTRKGDDGYYRRQIIFHSRRQLEQALEAARHWGDNNDREDEVYIFSKFIRSLVKKYAKQHLKEKE